MQVLALELERGKPLSYLLLSLPHIRLEIDAELRADREGQAQGLVDKRRNL
jgi:hypothetical protein